MSQYYTDSMSELDNFLATFNYQISATANTEDSLSFPELQGETVSVEFAPKPTSLFETTEKTDAPIDTSMQFDDFSTWGFPFEENPKNDISISPMNTKFPDLPNSLSLRTSSWTPSSSSEPESETASNFSPISLRAPNFRTSLSQDQNKKELQKITRLERRREKNRNSQRNFRKRKEQYVRDLEKQYTELQKKYDALLLIFCGKDNATVPQISELKEDRKTWEFQDLINPVE